MKRLSVKNETSSGFNTKIHDNYLGIDMTINQAVKKVENGLYSKYHVRTQSETGKNL